MTPASRREIGYFCSKCERFNLHELVSPPPETSETSICSECGNADRLETSEALVAGGPVERCPHCGNRELYLRKDFPQQLGCAAVTGTILLSSLAYALWDFPAALAVLVVASAADFLLYHRLGEVTVCYRCHAELRGFEPNPAHGPFDMHRAEEYEQGS